MTRRSVFVPRPYYPYFEEIEVEYHAFNGMAKSQKRKSQISLHDNFTARYPERKVLEISGASLVPLGMKLSAMNLRKAVDGKVTTAEAVFQSGRIFSPYPGSPHKRGPYLEYLYAEPHKAKTEIRKMAGDWHSYDYVIGDRHFYAPPFHISLYYDWVYLSALLEDQNRALREELLQSGYNAFTDLATRSLNCQARTVAMFLGLCEAGVQDRAADPDQYLELFRCSADGKALPGAYEKVQRLRSDGSGVVLLSPVVRETVRPEDTERKYRKYYSHISNRKTDDGFARPSPYDIDLSVIRRTGSAVDRKGAVQFLFAAGETAGVRIPAELIPEKQREAFKETVVLVKEETGMKVLPEELGEKTVWPLLNEEHGDIIEQICTQIRS